MTPSSQDLLKIAQEIALEAGALAFTMRHEGIDIASTKSNQLDIVTQADTAVEALIEDRLRSARPHDGFFGEENTRSVGTSGITWVVDPIDGTVNYLYGSRHWAVSIAATIELSANSFQTVAACVYAPDLEAVFTATSDGPAQLNGRTLRVNTPVELERSLLATGFSYDIGSREVVQADIDNLVREIRDFRFMGVATLAICAVAEGAVDGFFHRGLPLWDYAAASLIATRAGASVTGVSGTSGPDEVLIIAAPELMEELTSKLHRPASGPEIIKG